MSQSMELITLAGPSWWRDDLGANPDSAALDNDEALLLLVPAEIAHDEPSHSAEADMIARS
jgi:hypothetical protein